MIKDIGNAIDHKILTGETLVYLVDSKTKIEATEEFVKSLDDKNFLGVFEEKLDVESKPNVRGIKNAAMKEKGWQVIDKWSNKIGGTLIVFNSHLLELSGLKKITDEQQKERYEAQRGLIDVNVYKDIILINKDLQGEYSIFYAPNMWNKEGIKFESKGKDEAGFKISLESVDDGVSVPITVYSNFKELAKA